MRATRMGATMTTGQHFATPLHFEARSDAMPRDGFRACVCAAGMAALLSAAMVPVAHATDAPPIGWNPDAPAMDGSDTGGSGDGGVDDGGEVMPPIDNEGNDGGGEVVDPGTGDDTYYDPADTTETPDYVPSYDETYPDGATGSVAASPDAFADPNAAEAEQVTADPAAEAVVVPAPAVTGWSATDRVVSGTALAGATVQALAADGSVLGETAADEAGAFSLALPEGVDISAVSFVTLGADGTASAATSGAAALEQLNAQERARVTSEVSQTVSELAHNIDAGLAGTNLYSGYAQPEREALPILPYALGAGVGVAAAAVAVGVFFGLRRAVGGSSEQPGAVVVPPVQATPPVIDLGSTGQISPAPGVMPGVVSTPISSVAPGTTGAVAPIVAPAPKGFDTDLPTEAFLALTPNGSESAQATQVTASPESTVAVTPAPAVVSASVPADQSDDLDDLERLALSFSAAADAGDEGPDPDDDGPRGGTHAAAPEGAMDTLTNMPPVAGEMPPAHYVSRHAEQPSSSGTDLSGLDAFEPASVSGAGDELDDPLEGVGDWRALALAELAQGAPGEGNASAPSLDSTSGDTDAYLRLTRSTMPRTPVAAEGTGVAPYVAPVVGPSTPARVAPLLRDAAQRAKIERALSLHQLGNASGLDGFSDAPAPAGLGSTAAMAAVSPASAPAASEPMPVAVPQRRVSSLSVPLVDPRADMAPSVAPARRFASQRSRARTKSFDADVPQIQRAAPAPAASSHVVPEIGDLVDPLYMPTTRMTPVSSTSTQYRSAHAAAPVPQRYGVAPVAQKPAYIPASPLPYAAPAPAPVNVPVPVYAAPAAPSYASAAPAPRMRDEAGRSTYVPAIGDTGAWDARDVQPVGPAPTQGTLAWDGVGSDASGVWPVAAADAAPLGQTGMFATLPASSASTVSIPAVYGPNEQLPVPAGQRDDAHLYETSPLSPAYIDYLVQDEFEHRHESAAQRAAATGQFHIINGMASAPQPLRRGARHMA